MGGLDGRVALVTGGSRGIGRAISVRLAQDRADVAINYASNAEAADEAAELVRAEGRRCETYAADISSREACEALTEQVLADFGHVDILVNNAGVGATAVGRPLVADTKPEDFEWLMSTHAFGSWHLCQLLVPQMRELDRGDVVMISSTAAQGFGPTGGTYSAAKSAMEAVAHTLAQEERRHGIHVNIVAPGLVDTDMGFALVEFTQGVEDIRDLDGRMPFDHVCRPEEIASAVAFLVGRDGSYITNQRITVSGGGF